MTLVLPEGVPAAPPAGSRQLGLRMSPSLRLSIGFRNPARNNAPDKLDYFRAKEGANGEFKAAAAKFHSEEHGYGPTPKAIDVRLPTRLEDALRIEYLAFKGNRDDPAGGVMTARGETNFAALGYCGGPDTLTLFEQNGDVQHVRTKGIEALTGKPLDEIAASTGLMLCTTLRVGLPKILGYGSYCEITSKSMKSTDQLWAKLRDWYASFPNGTLTFAMQPKLVVKPAFARPLVKGKRMRVQVYVLDLVSPDSEEEMFARLERYQGSIQVTSGIMPDAAEPPALEAGAVPFDAIEEIADAEIVEDAGDAASPQDEDHHGDARNEPGPDTPSVAPAAEETNPSPEGTGPVELDALPLDSASEEASGQPPTPPDSTPRSEEEAVVSEEPVLTVPAPADGPTADEKAAADQAAKMRPPWGSYQTLTLGAIMTNPGGNGPQWIEYALGQCILGKESNATFEKALWAFVKVYLPDVYDKHKEHAK